MNSRAMLIRRGEATLAEASRPPAWGERRGNEAAECRRMLLLVVPERSSEAG
jgi:hypothetical protein